MTAREPAPAPALRFMIADDHAPFRAGVVEALVARGFVSVGDVADAESAIALAVRERPDICLIDLHMPGQGLTAVGQIARRVREALIIVLTVSDRSEDLLAALSQGAAGYLIKGMTGEQLATALRAAYDGEAALSRALVPVLVDHLRRGTRRRLVLPDGNVSLTAREWDVAELMRDRQPTKAIAMKLGLSPVTVRRHVATIVQKLGAPDRETAVQMLRTFGR